MKKIKYILFFFPHLIFSQITGVIIDKQTQKPVSGAFVSVVGKNLQVYSDKNGQFQIEAKQYDTIRVVALNYQTQNYVVQSSLSITIYLFSEEIIEAIGIQLKKVKETSYFWGDLRKTRRFFFRNTNFTFMLSGSTKPSNIFMSYIPNKIHQEGIIKKVFVRFVRQSSNVYEFNPISRERQKVVYQYPKFIKIRIVCAFADSKRKPSHFAGNQEMIFLVKNYQSQWIDISKYEVPFGKEGAFVGMQILEVATEEQMPSGVGIPLMWAENNENIDYDFTSRGWISKSGSSSTLQELSQYIKSRRYTYGFAAEVSFEK
jgi:hypothetical protein